MDSVTQAALGAAVGELVLGRAFGRRSILWGAALATAPDLDVLAYPWLDEVERLGWHRGLSHSLIAIAVATPVIAWLVRRASRGAIAWSRAAWFGFLVWATHVLIDCFTIYGTGIYEPFDASRVGIGNLFVIDPLFTLPMLVGIVAAWFRAGAPSRRFRAVAAGLTVSSAYAILSLGLQAAAEHRFRTALEQRGLAPDRMLVAATPFNTLYWRCVAETRDGFLIGYASLLDRDPALEFERVERGEALIRDLRASPAVAAVDRVTGGFFVARRVDGRIVLGDLRLGHVGLGRFPEGTAPLGFVFHYELSAGGGGLTPGRAEFGDVGEAFAELARRIVGRSAGRAR